MSSYIFYRKRDTNNRIKGPWLIAKCKKCGDKLLKDKNCSGDYYPCGDGAIILMSYCPRCGSMYPFISYTHFSNNRKKNIAIKIAKIHRKGFSETKETILNIRFTNEDAFAKEISEKLKINKKEIQDLF